MRKLFALCLALLLTASFAACGKEPTETPTEPASSSDWGIILSAKEVTPTGLTLVIGQSGGKPTGSLQYGSDYQLEVLKDGTWEAVPYAIEGDVAWTAEAYMVKMGDSAEIPVVFEHLYGALPVGSYRITKSFMDFRGTDAYDTQSFSAAFEISQDTDEGEAVSSDTDIDIAWWDLAVTDQEYHECTVDISKESSFLMLTPKVPVTDFRVVRLEYVESSDSEAIFRIVGEEFALDTLTPEKPLTIRVEMPETIPNVGITYMDRNGQQKLYALSMSGLDGDPLLIEIKIQ